MKLESFILIALLSSGIMVSIPEQAYADIGSNIRTTADLNQISRSITVLVNQGKGYGSGIIIGRDNSSYYVLTAAHVVNLGGSIQITAPDQRIYQASAITITLPNLDLAILEFQSEQEYEVATLADYKISEISGSNIYISGWDKNPKRNKISFSCGIVLPDSLAFLLRQDPINDGYELAYTNITQSGFSGGPILDNQGRVIGIHGRAEGEEFEAIGSLQLGLSLGIPSWKFLQVIRNISIQLPLIVDENLPENLFTQSSSGSNPCQDDISSPDLSSSAISWANYANSMLRFGRLVEALSAYDEALRRNINGELYQIWYGRGLTLILLDRPNEAFTNFDRALRLWSQLPNERNQNKRLNVVKALILRYQGMLLTANERYQEALSVYQEALTVYDKVLEVDPNNHRVWEIRAQLLTHLNRDQEAITAYSQAIRILPRTTIFLVRSNIYLKSGRYDLAVEDLNTAVQLSPYNPQIYAMRGAIRRESGDIQGGKRDYEQVYELALEFAPSSEFNFNYAKILIGQAELSVGNVDAGLDNFVQAIEGIGSGYTWTIASDLLRHMFSQIDNLQDAESYAEIWISSLERLNQTYGNGGEAAINLDESMIHLVRAMAFVTTNASLYSSNLLKVPNTEIVSAYYEIEQAIKLNRDNESIYLAYALRSAFRANQGDEKGATSDFEKALNLAPNSIEIYYLRGKTHLALGNLQKSLNDLQIAAQIAHEKRDMETYQEVMSLIDRVQSLSY